MIKGRSVSVLFVIGMAAAVFGLGIGPLSAQEAVKKTWEDKLPEADPAEAEIEGTEEALEGMVSGAGYNGLAVELSNPKKNEPSEIWFNYVKGIKLSGIQRLAELQEGDKVSVGYRETRDGRRFLKEIRLIRKKPVEETPLPAEEEMDEE